MTTYLLLALTDDGRVRLAPVNGNRTTGFRPKRALEPTVTGIDGDPFVAFETEGFLIEIDVRRTEPSNA